MEVPAPPSNDPIAESKINLAEVKQDDLKQKSRNIVEDMPINLQQKFNNKLQSIKSDFESEIQRLPETDEKKEASFKNQHEPQIQAFESKLRQSESKTLVSLDKSQIIHLIQQYAPQSTYDENIVYNKLT